MVDSIGAFITACGLSAVVGFGIGIALARGDCRAAAVEAGAGRWVIDEKNGDSEFVWGCGPSEPSP